MNPLLKLIRSKKFPFSKTVAPMLLVAVFLSRIPPINIIPTIEFSLLQSHNIARLLIITAFLILLLKYNKPKIERYVLVFIILFLVSISTSILGALNVQAFLSTYKELIISILFFYVIVTLGQKRDIINLITLCLFSTILLNIFINLVIYYEFQPLYALFTNVFYYKYSLYNLDIHTPRGRFFTDMADPVLIPIVVCLLLSVKNKLAKIIALLTILALILLSLISGYRAHLVVAIAAIILSVIFLNFHNKTKSIVNLSILIFTFIYIISTFVSVESYTSLNRLGELTTDNETLKGRLFLWDKAVEMGLSSPAYGIGMGNFYDNLYPKKLFNQSLFNPRNKLMEVTYIHPHNIFFAVFAESGFLGLISIICLLAAFAVKDYYNFNRGNLSRAYILSFWLLVTFFLVVPDNTFQFKSLFWILRGVILVYPK